MPEAHSPVDIRFSGVGKHFLGPDGTAVPAIEGIDLTAEAGRLTTIVGPSGCGKSTLLSMAAGLFPPTHGEILIGGTPVTSIDDARRAGVGFITQEANLLPWMNVLDNVALPLRIAGIERKERERRARSWLERVQLSGYERYLPSQLSGGMQKRCAVARTMCYEPRVILMDEPFGALDALTKLYLQDLLLGLLGQLGNRTVVFVTHDLAEAVAISDKVAVISGRPGRLREVVPIDLPKPRDVFHISKDPGFGPLQVQLWDLIAADSGAPPPTGSEDGVGRAGHPALVGDERFGGVRRS